MFLHSRPLTHDVLPEVASEAVVPDGRVQLEGGRRLFGGGLLARLGRGGRRLRLGRAAAVKQQVLPAGARARSET